MKSKTLFLAKFLGTTAVFLGTAAVESYTAPYLLSKLSYVNRRTGKEVFDKNPECEVAQEQNQDKFLSNKA